MVGHASGTCPSLSNTLQKKKQHIGARRIKILNETHRVVVRDYVRFGDLKMYIGSI